MQESIIASISRNFGYLSKSSAKSTRHPIGMAGGLSPLGRVDFSKMSVAAVVADSATTL